MVLTELVNKNCVVNTHRIDLHKREQNVSFPDKCAITDVRVSGDFVYVTVIHPHDSQHTNRAFVIFRGPEAFVYQFDLDLIGTDMMVLGDGGYEIVHIFMRRR